jgi:hypothetical protein
MGAAVTAHRLWDGVFEHILSLVFAVSKQCEEAERKIVETNPGYVDASPEVCLCVCRCRV